MVTSFRQNLELAFCLRLWNCSHQEISGIPSLLLRCSAEGVNTVQIVRQKANDLGVYMPIVSGLHDIIFNRQPIQEVIGQLMQGGQSSDVEFMLPRTGTLA